MLQCVSCENDNPKGLNGCVMSVFSWWDRHGRSFFLKYLLAFYFLFVARFYQFHRILYFLYNVYNVHNDNFMRLWVRLITNLLTLIIKICKICKLKTPLWHKTLYGLGAKYFIRNNARGVINRLPVNQKCYYVHFDKTLSKTKSK